MGRTKLLVSCLLLFILSETFLSSGKLSEIHFIPSRSVSKRNAICLQMNASTRLEPLFQVHVGVYFDLKIQNFTKTCPLLTTVLKNEAEINLSHFNFNRTKVMVRSDFKYSADKRIDDALLNKARFF